ncbi:protein RER1 [Nadsonia fulvescens var. elongata DSM 6958]|uniref:Protein RER1 n=1 Tax=Nadsonia fulvescens var. elongata DSM 6958 TaxID=857566 RepID=A0A1E3PQH8_9ASCO|nr:protein RER1 [Nadsonia fulvescens var. elongata DSM 6958]
MDFSNPSSPPACSLPEKVQTKLAHIQRLYQAQIDHTVPHILNRWIAFGLVLALFMLRIFLAQGWYIVCYTLGIYLLNLLLAFLQPKFDPSLEQEMREHDTEEGLTNDGGAEGGESSESGEFRPFIRRLSEFKCWYNATRATTIGLFCTFFELFNVPVFWPILLMYFIILFTLTMKKQIQHMLKYKYLPFDLGKAKYSRK